jgi:hypothetical protein
MEISGGQKAHLLSQGGYIEALEVMVFEQTGCRAGPGGAVGFFAWGKFQFVSIVQPRGRRFRPFARP